MDFNEKMIELEMIARAAVEKAAAEYAQQAQASFEVRCQERGHETMEDVGNAKYPKDDPIMIDVADIVEWKDAGSKVWGIISSAFRDLRR
jgi:hypothetical protein